MSQFRLRDIQPNPFRHVGRYPIQQEKVSALRESFKTTGFWGNIVARERPDGKPEISYGHHRLHALREEYGPNTMIDLIVRDLSDETMLQIMARENMQEWGTSAAVEQETVRAVVEAYAAGQIELPAPDRSTSVSQLRFAPSFVPGNVDGARRERPYTGQILAEFLGWVAPKSGRAQDKVFSAVTALQFIEEGILTESDFTGLTTKEAEAVVEQARKARANSEAAAKLAEKQAKEAKAKGDAEQAKQQTKKATDERKKGKTQAKKVGKAVGGKLRRKEITYRQAGKAAQEVKGEKEKPPPHIEAFTVKLATNLNKILSEDKHAEALGKLIPFRHHPDLSNRTRTDIIRTLKSLAGRAEKFADALAAPEQKEIPEKTGGIHA